MRSWTLRTYPSMLRNILLHPWGNYFMSVVNMLRHKLFCWSVNGRILMKIRPDDKPIQITSENCLSATIQPLQYNSLSIMPVDEAQVYGLICNLRSDCSTGPDNIPIKILKQSITALTSPITHICNRSIDLGSFPKAFKKPIVHPIFKRGEKTNITNYRPISVLSSLRLSWKV